MVNKYIYYLIIVLRVIFAPLILIWPYTASIVSFFLDVFDADFACYVVSKKQYQLIDKTLDIWLYIFEMILVWRMFIDYRYLLLFLLIWRIIGTIIFYLTNNRKVFLLFANYFENIFFVLLFQKYLFNISITSLIVIAFILKFIQEWFIHYANLSVREDFIGSIRKWR